MAVAKTNDRLLEEKKRFCNIQNLYDLSVLLYCPARKLFHISYDTRYKTFKIPKGTDKFRIIETPYEQLKEIQQVMNGYLQACYYTVRTDAAYGFMPKVVNEVARNVRTNALAHLGKTYLVNIDLTSFFHQIHRKRVFRIFRQKPFKFEPYLAAVLTRLTTYNGHLPMGTSTSPVLSNFACFALDHALGQLAESKKWTYTRFVDDLSFSSYNPITETGLQRIRNVIKTHQFQVNEKKVKYYGETDKKEVTGVALNDFGLTMPMNFVKETAQEIQEYQSALTLGNRYGRCTNDWIDKLEKRIKGRLCFTGYICGKKSEAYQQLNQQYKAVRESPTDFVPVSWDDYCYHY